MSTTAKIQDAKEVAAFVSKGLQPKEVAQKVDLPLTYVLELTELPEFIKLGYNVEGTTRAVHKDGVVIKSTIVRRRDYKYPWRVPFKIKQAKPKTDHGRNNSPPR